MFGSFGEKPTPFLSVFLVSVGERSEFCCDCGIVCGGTRSVVLETTRPSGGGIPRDERERERERERTVPPPPRRSSIPWDNGRTGMTNGDPA